MSYKVVYFDYTGDKYVDISKITYIDGNLYAVSLTPLYADIVLTENFEEMRKIIRRLKIDKVHNNIEHNSIDISFLSFLIDEYEHFTFYRNSPC